MSKGNEPAYPVVGELMVVQNIGLTKRELFAMAAMQGLCQVSTYPNADYAAAQAVEHADALIAALEGK